MPRNPIAIAIATASLALAGCAPRPPADGSGAPTAGRPPNIVFIMADDLGYGDVGPYGQSKILTPSLDRMAGEGLRFTQFYAGSPVCAPSRAALMTGLDMGRSPIRGNLAVPDGQQPLPGAVTTLAELLREAGYATGAFGKWGLGPADSEGAPTRQGFDEFYGYLDQSRAHFFYPEYLHRGTRPEPLPGNRVKPGGNTPGANWVVERGVYSHDAIVREALSFVDRNRTRPFFLYVPFTIPHAELEAPADAYAPYLDASGRSVFPETPYPGQHYGPQPMPHATYAAMVTRMDRDVGRILDRLREHGLDENTIVFFTSDNGPSIEGGSDPEFFDSNGPLRGVKRDVYEGGIRVPMIVRWPGRVPAGRSSDHVWAMWDVLPTLTRLSGARTPAALDGLDMSSALFGSGAAPRHEHLYWEFHEQGGKQAVRRADWKGVRLNAIANPDAPLELYDLASDLGETRNVASAHPEIVREMERIMAREHIPSELFPALDRARGAPAAP